MQGAKGGAAFAAINARPARFRCAKGFALPFAPPKPRRAARASACCLESKPFDAPMRIKIDFYGSMLYTDSGIL